MVLDKLLKLYQPLMDANSKVILLKIMHISIIVHSPEPVSGGDVESVVVASSQQNDNLFSKSIAGDAMVWHKHLRNMFSMIEREIVDQRKRSNRLNPTPVICPIFLRTAAKLCSIVSVIFVFRIFLPLAWIHFKLDRFIHLQN